LVLETSIALLRVGLGLIKLAVQAMVWATVLFYLLAMGNDPVAICLELLPISGHARAKASETITNAMRGVFVSSLKLSVFHALFSWLTLSMAGCHFVYLLTALSTVVAILPLIPVWLIAIPAALALALLKEELLRGFLLVGVHFGAYNWADDLILREIEPSQPYLTGLGIFGGMYTFASPLQGVLLGPMLLALLSVGHNLHREFLRS
jgi:predicted PurR-regulated permease PerM